MESEHRSHKKLQGTWLPSRQQLPNRWKLPLRQLGRIGLAIAFSGEVLLGSFTLKTSPALAAPVVVNVCFKTNTELDLNRSTNANTKAKLTNSAYFGSTGSAAPETFNFVSLTSVTSTALSSNNCQIYFGGGSLLGNGTDDLTTTEVAAVSNWLQGSGRFLIAGCDYAGQSSQICSFYRTMTNIANGGVSINSILSYNPLTCGGALTVATFGGISSYFTMLAGDVLLAKHNTAGQQPAAITDSLVTPKFLFTGDADMFGSSGATAIGAGPTASSDQAKLVVNSFKFALDAIMGRLGNPQCFASYDQKADLELSISTSNASPVLGGQTTVTITVVNKGPTNVTGVTAIANLPSGLSLASQSGTGSYSTATQAWSIGVLNSGTSASITLTLNVTSAGSLSIPAQITQSSHADIDSSTNVGFGVDDLSDGIADDDEASVTITSSVPTISVSGKVWNDADGNGSLNGSEVTTDTVTDGANDDLYAVLTDSSNQVLQVASITDNTGVYSFSNVGQNIDVKILLSTMQPSIGSTFSTSTLTSGWVSTLPAASVQSFNTGTTNVSNKDFGIEQLPETNPITATSQVNPSGTSTVQVSTLSGTDPEDGALGTGKSFKIVTLPTNGTLYYNNTAVTAGQIISNYDPSQFTVDPNDGAITVSFTYAAVDAAGKEDPTPATVSMPFSTTVSLNPNVLLVKRITAINGDRIKNPNDNTPLDITVDDASLGSANDTLSDTDPNWPLPTSGVPAISTFLKGAVNAGQLNPGDTIEYTIYFLNTGGAGANNVKICDRILGSQVFLPAAYGASNDIQLQIGNGSIIGLTKVDDTVDRGAWFPSDSLPSSCNLQPVPTGVADNGAISVQITGTGNTGQPDLTGLSGATAPGTPGTSYGFIRFTTKVK